MRLLFTEPARADLRAIHAYHAERSPDAAERVVSTLLRAASGLLTFPLLGRAGDVAGTRERTVTRYPYRITYALTDEEVIVLRVLHTAQNWP